MKPLFSTTPTINRIFSLILVGIGAAGIGLQARWFAERSVYQSYTTVVDGVTGIKTVGTSIDIIIAGAAIVLVGGVIGLLATLSTSNGARILYIISLAIALIGGIVELAGGVTVQSHPYLSAIGPNTYVFNEGRSSEEHLSGDQEKMAMFGIAMFEGCCRSQTVPAPWASMGPFGACNVPCPSENSGRIIDERVELFTENIDVADLCTCVRSESQSMYAEYLSKFNTATCNVLKDVQVDFVPSVNIPTTCEKYNFCLSLGFIKDRLYKNTPISKVPLVGYQLDAATSQGTAPEGEGFGCGLGYQKGVMWVQEIYHDQVIRPAGSSGVGLGAASIVVVILIFVLGYFLAKEDHEMGDTKWENSLAAGWNDPATNPAPVAKVVDSAPPAASSWTAPPVAAYQANANDFGDQLLKFYAKHDPTKTQKEIDGIATWGKQNGLAALNKKLRDKYGADLSGGDGGPPI